MRNKNTINGIVKFLLGCGTVCFAFVTSFSPRLSVFEIPEAKAAPVTIILNFNQTILTEGTTWTVPSDWTDNNNTIEVIGGGGAGRSDSAASNGAGGGGGGAYSKSVNVDLTPGGTLTYQIGVGGNVSSVDGTDTYFCSGTSNCADINGSAVVAGAKGGSGATSATGAAGGLASSGVATGTGNVKYNGGDGGTGHTNSDSGGGGGGAAGPNGDGGDGGAGDNDNTTDGVGGGGGGNGGGANGGSGITSDTVGGAGGNGNGGSGGGSGGSAADGGNGSAGGGGGGGSDAMDGGNGGSGTDLNGGSVGSGGGGGGGGDFGSIYGGDGGLYGAGGGGGRYGGRGAPGIIVITYNGNSPTMTSWTVPSDWNSSSNTIEVIGAGGAGYSVADSNGAAGGGGGAYSKITNLTLTPGNSVTYQIGQGGRKTARGAGAGVTGGDTFFNRTSGSAGTCADTTSVCAKGGTGATSVTANGVGGASGSGTGTTKVSGGDGGDGNNTGDTSGGGGGAAQAGEAGQLGGTGSATADQGGGGGGGGGDDSGTDSTAGTNGGIAGGAGGNGRANSGGGTAGSAGTSGTGGGGGGGNDASSGGNGATGNEWTSAGAGGGGGGGGDNTSASTRGGDGGFAGGGGGGGSLGGFGGNGIIVITYDPISVITISGTCHAHDQSTACGDLGTVKVAVNGSVQAQTDTGGGSGGAFSISSVATPSNGDSIIVFIDGASSTDRAVAVTKYDGSGNIDNLKLFKEHVTIGTDGGSNSDQTVTLANMDDYDYDNDADVFYDIQLNETCEGTAGFTGLCVDGGDVSTQHELYIVGGDTFAPAGNIKTHDIEIVGTFTGNGNTYTVTGSWLDTGTFTPATSIVQFTATGTGETITTTGSSFNHLVFNGSGGGWTLQDSTTVSGVLHVTAGNFSAGSATLTLSGNQDAWCSDNSGVTCESTNWAYRKKITFDNTASAGALTNFPVLVQLSSSNIDYSKTKDAGEDIRFVDPADNTVVLDHEIEVWNESGTSYVWVEVPSLAASGVDYIWMYYGYASASDGQNASGVWDSNAVSVWHLGNGDSTAADFYTDSKGSNEGTLTDADGDSVQATGKVGYAMDLNGDADEIIKTDNASLDITDNLTIEAWFNLDSLATSQTIVSKWHGSGDYSFNVSYDSGSDKLAFQTDPDGDPFSGNGCYIESGTGLVSAGTWYHIAASQTGSTLTLYLNGSPLSVTTTGTCGSSIYSGAANLEIGSIEHNIAQWLNGKIDEVRISSTAVRSADWIEANYLFTNNGSKYSYGPEETQGSGVFAVGGTFTAASSTVDFTSAVATTIPGLSYNNLGIKPGADSITHTLGSGTFTVGGNLTLGNGSNTGVTVQGDTNDPELNIAGNITISASTTFQASDSALVAVGGNWTTTGTFTHNSGTVTFNGTGTSKTINGGSSSFNNVAFDGSGSEWSPLTNTLTVVGELTMTAGTLNNDDGSASIVVNANVICGVTCGNIALTAGTFTQSVTQNQTFGTSASGSTAWSFNNLTFTGTTDTITASSVGTGSITVAGTLTISASTTLDAENRTWVLSGTGTPFVVSGTFTADTSTFQYTHGTSATVTRTTFNNLTLGGTGTYTLPGAGWTITGNLVVTNGATVTKGAGTITWSPTGTKTWTDNTASKQDVGEINITGGSSTPVVQLASSVKATKITVAGSHNLNGGGSYTLTLTGTDGTPLSVSGTFTASSSTVEYAGANGSGNTTVANVTYNNLTLNASDTFVLAGTQTVSGNLTITAGTLDTVNGQSYALNVGGNWSNSGTFTPRSGTVTFTATSGTKTIDNGSSTFYNLAISGSGGTFQPSNNPITVSNAMTVNTGATFSGTLGVTVNGGDVTGDGTINMTGGTFLIDGDSGAGFGGYGQNWTFYNLTFGDGTGTTATTSGAGNIITVTNVMTISANHTLDNTMSFVLSGNGTPLVRNGTMVLDSGSTFTYTSGSGVTALSSAAMTGTNAFGHLVINGSGTLTAGVEVEAANVTVTTGTLSMAGNNLTVGRTSATNSGNIKVASGQTFSQSSSATTTLVSSGSGSNCIGSNGASCAGTAGTITFGGLIIGNDATTFTTTIGGTSPTVTVSGDLLINNNATLNAGSATLSLTNNGSTVFSKDASGTFTASSSTVSFVPTATTGVTVPALAYYNLTLNKASNTFTAENSTYVIGNNFTLTAGSFVAPSSATFSVSGNFANSGTFTHNSGTVTFAGSGVSNITGATTFNNFTVATAGKVLKFEAGTTFTFAGTVSLTGSQSNFIWLQSTSDGNQWFVTFNGAQSGWQWIYVRDGGCIGGQTASVNETVISQGNNGSCWGIIIRGGSGGGTDGGGTGGGGGSGGGGSGGGGESEGGGGGGGAGGGGGGGAGGGGGSP